MGRFFRRLGVGLSLLSLFIIAAAGPGAHTGLWPLKTGFSLLRYGAYGGFAAMACALLAMITGFRSGAGRKGGLAIFFALTAGALSAGVPTFWWQVAHTVPLIHDITTDTDNPPVFVAILRLRQDAPNPPEYGGPSVAQAQKSAYPDIKPLILDAPTAGVFDRALSAAKSLHWEIVDSQPGEGRIEATATTRWFRFKDDVVIRVMPEGRGSRVDVRSVSRVGKGDLGANARRIRAFLAAMNK